MVRQTVGESGMFPVKLSGDCVMEAETQATLVHTISRVW